MLFPRRSFGNPLLQQRDLFHFQRSGLLRHPFIFILSGHPPDQLAHFRLARHNRWFFRFPTF
jgi:hypothetical protein